MTKTHGLRALIAEDDNLMAVVLELALMDLDIDIDIVASGEEAVEAAGEYDVVFLDLLMPGRMDGLTAGRAIAGMPNPPKLVFVTGNRDSYTLMLMTEVTPWIIYKPLEDDWRDDLRNIMDSCTH